MVRSPDLARLSAPLSRPALAVALLAVGCLGGIVGAGLVLFIADGAGSSDPPNEGADVAALKARVSELESQLASKPRMQTSFSMAAPQRGVDAERHAPKLEDLTEHPRFAEAVGDVIDELEAAHQAEKADEKTRRRVDRILAFTDSLSEELRLNETQRLEVARVLTDESSRYRRAKDELKRVTIEEGLTPRERREQKAKLREEVGAESRDELSRILSSNQLTELLRIREEEGMDPDD